MRTKSVVWRLGLAAVLISFCGGCYEGVSQGFNAGLESAVSGFIEEVANLALGAVFPETGG